MEGSAKELRKVDLIDERMTELISQTSKCMSLAIEIECKLFGAELETCDSAEEPEAQTSSVIIERWLNNLKIINKTVINLDLQLNEVLKKL